MEAARENDQNCPVDDQKIPQTPILDPITMQDYFPEDGDVDSDQESYTPPLHHIMQENMDQGIEIDDDSTTTSSSLNEVESLIVESQMPIEELRRRYETVIAENGTESHFGLDIMEPERKRRKLVQRYLFDTLSDYEDILSSWNRKTVPIGPQYQIDVPDQCLTVPYPENEPSLDELVWDPSINSSANLAEFFKILSSHHPLIKFEDELVMALYMKHRGNIAGALSDRNDVESITRVQTSPLTCFLVDECQEFKNAMLKCGKNFVKIHLQFFPHYTVKTIVEFYYIWKKSPLYDDYLMELELRLRGQAEGSAEGTFSMEAGSTNFCTDLSNQGERNNNVGALSKSSVNSESAPLYNGKTSEQTRMEV